MSILNTIIKGIAGNTVTINGKTYTGSTVTIKNNKVIVDGNEVECDEKKVNYPRPKGRELRVFASTEPLVLTQQNRAA